LPDIEERFVLSEKGEIPFYGQQFDVITMLWVLPYIPDLRGCLRNVESFLKPNGVLIASTVNRFSIHTVAAMLNYLRYIKRNPQWFQVIRNLWSTGFWTGGASADSGGCDITSACRFDDLLCKHGFNLTGELNFYNLRLGKLHFGDRDPLGRGLICRWLARHLGWEHIGCFIKSAK